MKIKDIEIRMCRHKEPVMKDSEMRDGKKSDLEFLVITFHISIVRNCGGQKRRVDGLGAET